MFVMILSVSVIQELRANCTSVVWNLTYTPLDRYLCSNIT